MSWHFIKHVFHWPNDIRSGISALIPAEKGFFNLKSRRYWKNCNNSSGILKYITIYDDVKDAEIHFLIPVTGDSILWLGRREVTLGSNCRLMFEVTEINGGNVF